jgi:hypothetical protein
MTITQVLEWLGVAVGVVGATALVLAGALPLVDDVLADSHRAPHRDRGRPA